MPLWAESGQISMKPCKVKGVTLNLMPKSPNALGVVPAQTVFKR